MIRSKGTFPLPVDLVEEELATNPIGIRYLFDPISHSNSEDDIFP